MTFANLTFHYQDWPRANFSLRYLYIAKETELSFERRGGIMVSVFVSGASGPGSSPGRGHCVVFSRKTLYPHSASIHQGL